MLIQKPLSINDIVTVKLLNGEEIVGRFVSSDASGYTIGKPVVVVIQPVSQSQMSLAFAPFLCSSDEDANVVLPITSLLTKPIKTRSDVEKNYRKATSNLETVSDISSLLQ